MVTIIEIDPDTAAEIERPRWYDGKLLWVIIALIAGVIAALA